MDIPSFQPIKKTILLILSTSMPKYNNLNYLTTLMLVVLFSFALFGEGVVVAQEESYELDQEVSELIEDTSAIIGQTLIVQYDSDKDEDQVEEDFENADLVEEDGDQVELVDTNTALVTLNDEEDLEKGLKVALSQSDVAFAQPLYRYTPFSYTPTSNPNFTGQWYLQDTPSGINLPGAFGELGDFKDVNCTSSPLCGGESTVKVAVIDSGVNLDGVEIAADSVDVANGTRFFYNNDNTCEPGEFFETLNLGSVQNPILINFCQSLGEFPDSEGHGTTVASSIIMEDNSTNGVGTAFNTTLLPIALNGVFTSNSFIVGEAMVYAVDNGAQVINLSMGTSVDDPFLRQAIQYAYNSGVTVVVSSGNCGNKTAFTCGIGSDNITVNPLIYPAEYPEVISVGATNYGVTINDVARSSYSSFGSSLDVVVGVGDGVANPWGVHGFNENGVYSTTNTGTSFASPVVAGVVALAYSMNPDLTPGLIKDALINSSTDLGVSGFDIETGNGLLDAEGFLQYIRTHYPQWSGPSDLLGAAGNINAVEFNGGFVQVMRGDDNGIYTRSTGDGVTWTAWELSGFTITDIAMVVSGPTLVQTVRGTDDGIYTRTSTDAVTWTPWAWSGATLGTVSIGVLGTTIIQTVRGVDDGIYTRSSVDGLTWTPWIGSGATISDIEIVVLGSTAIQAVRGTDNGAYTRTSSDGVNWGPWAWSGSTTLQEVQMEIFGSQVVQTLRSTDNSIQTRTSADGIVWTDWVIAGFTFSAVTVEALGNTLVQSVRGTDNGIYTRLTVDGTTWTPWIGNGFTYNTVGLETVNGKLYQTVVGTDGLLYLRITDDGQNWGAWQSFAPAAITPSIYEFNDIVFMNLVTSFNRFYEYQTNS